MQMHIEIKGGWSLRVVVTRSAPAKKSLTKPAEKAVPCSRPRPSSATLIKQLGGLLIAAASVAQAGLLLDAPAKVGNHVALAGGWLK